MYSDPSLRCLFVLAVSMHPLLYNPSFPPAAAPRRSVLDIAVEPSDWMICLATLDVADTSAMNSTVSDSLDGFNCLYVE